MPKTREKKTLIKGQISPTDAEAAFGEFAKADARSQQINAKMDLEMAKIREKYQDELNELQEIKDGKFQILDEYARQNPQLFEKRRSIEFVHGLLGYRTGTPKLKLMKGFNWAKVLDNLKHYLPEYVRTTEEPAKDRLLADREVIAVKESIGKCGAFVDQDETFFVEPKKEEATATA